VAILAGGLAVRLRPLTDKIPKCLLPVAGRPFLYHQLDWLREQQVREVMLCVGFLGDQVYDAVGDGSRFGLSVGYSFDGDRLRGTGGALYKALPLLGRAFFVLYGDSYIQCPLSNVEETFSRLGKRALMTIIRNDGKWDKSNVRLLDPNAIRYNKKSPTPDMSYIDYGLSVVRSSIFEGYETHDSFDLADVLTDLSDRGELAGFEVAERFYEIGSSDGLMEAEGFLRGEEKRMTYSRQHLDEAAEVLKKIDADAVERLADLLMAVKTDGGRLFFLGVGGSAGNCSHAVNDFRKIVGIEAYAPTDNVSELTARINDDGWASVFSDWLSISRLKKEDCVFVLSVGGGDIEKDISPNLVRAVNYAKSVGAKVAGVVGRDGGYTAKVADAIVIVPTVNPETITPHSEAFQSVVWHLLVSHPKLKANPTKWESVKAHRAGF